MEENIYFMPGDTVTLKQELPNKPIMIVVKKETMNIRTASLLRFKALKTTWHLII